MNIKINMVDAFTDQIFKGNQAAVIITEQWLSEALMQSIATENNLSETAFLIKTAQDHFKIRWFSPIKEIDFCGHATLASAHVIFSEHPELNHITIFASAVGEMTINKLDQGFIQMDFPNRKPVVVTNIPDALFEGLSLKPSEVLQNQQAYFAVFNDEEDIAQVVQYDDILKKLAPYDVVVTAKSTNSAKYDFISRYFWPANGGSEDPVTGSIHAGLAPYWSEKLQKNELIAYQASKRGGILKCTVLNDRVLISGKVVPYLTGTIHV